MAASLLLAGTVLASSPAFAQGSEAPAQALKRVEQGIDADKTRQRQLEQQSQSLQKELESLRGKLVGLADEERAQGNELDQLEDSLTALEGEEQDRAARLEGERAQIASLLAALQRLARIPPEAVLARPDGPVDTLRSALLLRDAVPALRARADALSDALAKLAETREKLEAQRGRTLAARMALAARQKEMGDLVARREELSRQTETERLQVAQHTAQLASQATDLRQLMERIEAERRAAAEAAAKREAERLEAERREAERRLAEQREAERRLAAQKEAERKEAERRLAEQREAERRLAEQKAAEQKARIEAELGDAPTGTAGMRQPAGGSVAVRFGEADRYGATSRGIVIRARPGGIVIAPQAGTIVFAGPFRGYGQILIVEHSNGYHSLLAGFGRIDTAVGKRVATGEPIGLMPSDGTPDLYFELRRHGQPINPQRGLGAPEGKGQG